MASRIAGLTIEIGGDTTKLQKSLKNVDSQLKKTQDNLKDINKLLKLDPSNVELLRQKQKNLESAISLTKDRLEELKTAQSQYAKGSAEYDAVQREIVETENKLKDLQKEMRNFGSVSSQQLKAVGQSLKDAGSKVTGLGQKLSGISGAAAGIGTGLLKLGYDAVQNADDLNTLAKQTGLTTAEIQKMQYASDLIDVSFEDIAGALKKLKTGMAGDSKALAKLKIATRNEDGTMRDATEVFYEALAALSKIENETERDQVAMELFGKSADSLAGIVDDGGEALKAYGDQAEELGLILDQDTLDALNETNDTIDQLKKNIGGTMAKIGSDVATILSPALEKGAALIGQITEKLRQLTPEQQETILKVIGIVAAVAPVLIVGGKLISGIGTLISVIGTVVGVLGGPLTIAIAAVIAAGIFLYKNWDKVTEVAQNMKEKVMTSFDNIKERVSGTIDTMKAKIDAFKKKFDELKEKVTSVWNTIKGILTGQISLPHIPLPHFAVQPPGWKIGDLLQGSIPSLGISWYKKAYDNPVMFTSPTVMATPNGYKGFGDGHGAEIVMGLDKLREVVGASNVTINVYASEGMDINQLADKIQDRFVALARQRRMVNA